MRFSKAVVKYRVAILIVALALLAPAVLGMVNTRINYDMLDYLPEDMDTVIGQNELLSDFGKGAFSLVIVEDMPAKDVAALKEKIAEVEHVDSVVWYDSIADLRLPMELLPDSVYQKFNTDNATLMAVFFDSATSADVTMDAIRQIRSLAGQQCFVTGMSALVTDLKDLCEREEPVYVGLAVLLACAAMMLLLDSWLAPLVFLFSIGVSIVYNLGTNVMLGEISYITKAMAAVLQLAVTMDYSIFLWHSYNEQREQVSDPNEAMANAVHATLSSVVGSSATTEWSSLLKDVDLSLADAADGDMDQLTVAMTQLLDGGRQLSEGASALNDGVGQVAGGLSTLSENSETLNAGALQVFQLLLQTANQQLKALNPQVPDLTVETYAEVLDGLTQQMTAAKQTKTEAFQSLQVLKAQLDSYNQFYTGLTAYTAGVDQLSANMPALTDGATALNDGAAQLYAGLQTLDQDGLQTLTSMVNDEWKPLFENARALADDTEAYQSYAGKADDAEGVVRFIWRTDAIGD